MQTIIRAKQLLKLNITKLKPRYHKNIYKINNEKIEPECKIEEVTFIKENNVLEMPFDNQPIKNNFIQNHKSNNLISNQIINNNSIPNNKSFNDSNLNNKSFNNTISNNKSFNNNNSKEKDILYINNNSTGGNNNNSKIENSRYSNINSKTEPFTYSKEKSSNKNIKYKHIEYDNSNYIKNNENKKERVYNFSSTQPLSDIYDNNNQIINNPIFDKNINSISNKNVLLNSSLDNFNRVNEQKEKINDIKDELEGKNSISNSLSFNFSRINNSNSYKMNNNYIFSDNFLNNKKGKDIDENILNDNFQKKYNKFFEENNSNIRYFENKNNLHENNLFNNLYKNNFNDYKDSIGKNKNNFLKYSNPILNENNSSNSFLNFSKNVLYNSRSKNLSNVIDENFSIKNKINEEGNIYNYKINSYINKKDNMSYNILGKNNYMQKDLFLDLNYKNNNRNILEESIKTPFFINANYKIRKNLNIPNINNNISNNSNSIKINEYSNSKNINTINNNSLNYMNRNYSAPNYTNDNKKLERYNPNISSSSLYNSRSPSNVSNSKLSNTSLNNSFNKNINIKGKDKCLNKDFYLESNNQINGENEYDNKNKNIDGIISNNSNEINKYFENMKKNLKNHSNKKYLNFNEKKYSNNNDKIHNYKLYNIKNKINYDKKDDFIKTFNHKIPNYSLTTNSIENLTKNKINNGKKLNNKLTIEEIKSIFLKNKEKRDFERKNNSKKPNNNLYSNKNNEISKKINKQKDLTLQTLDNIFDHPESKKYNSKTLIIDKEKYNNILKVNNSNQKKYQKKNLSLNNIYSGNSQVSKITKTSKLIDEISKSNEKLKKEIEKYSVSNKNQNFIIKQNDEIENQNQFKNSPILFKYKLKEEPFYISSSLNNIQIHQNKLSYNYNSLDYKSDLKLPKQNSENDYKNKLKRNQTDIYLNNYLYNLKSFTTYNSRNNEKISHLNNDYLYNMYNKKGIPTLSTDTYEINKYNINKSDIYNRPRITYEIKNHRNKSYSSMRLNNNDLFIDNNNNNNLTITFPNHKNSSTLTFQNNKNYTFENNELNRYNVNSIYQRRKLIDNSYNNLYKEYHYCYDCNGYFDYCCKCGLLYNNYMNNHQNNSQTYSKCYFREQNY